MHNCTETKERFTELVLDGRITEISAAELDTCAECRAELDALNMTLRMTSRLSETAAPAESYWSGYHARLRDKLAIAPNPSHAEKQRRKEKLGPLFETMRLCVRTQVRVPLPLALAAIIACLALGVFAFRRKETPVAQPPLLVHVPVQVPVVQEKVVTRVVYRDRRSSSRNSRRAINDDAQAESTFAKSRTSSTDEIPASLNGFKPTDEVKLTVIKGGSPYEK
ncbi:MAG TPA: hypothetical protein VGN10_00670 [Pyrinomonadaceae bacterium]|jgi:hypothetical protein